MGQRLKGLQYIDPLSCILVPQVMLNLWIFGLLVSYLRNFYLRNHYFLAQPRYDAYTSSPLFSCSWCYFSYNKIIKMYIKFGIVNIEHDEFLCCKRGISRGIRLIDCQVQDTCVSTTGCATARGCSNPRCMGLRPTMA